MDPKDLLAFATLFIALDGLPHERLLFDEKKEGDGGGGGNAPPKTFTQDEVNSLLAKERRGLEAKIKELEPLKEQAAKSTELEKQIAELNEKIELAGKSEKEKEKLLAEKLTAKLEKEKSDLAKERDAQRALADQAAAELKRTRLEHQITAALMAAKALPGSLKFAVPAFLAEAEIEADEKKGHAITSVTIDGVPYKELAKATEAYLKANPLFLQAPEGGGGTRASNAGASGNWKDLPADQMADLAFSQAPNR